ncbi:hypothetical protein KA005_03545, partial [bacterium]|nr:hypothetical protein [bacterium]
ERADGRGLCEAYEDIIYGPDFSDLIADGYLSQMQYFCPPFDFKVKKRGDDYDPKTIEEILESRKIYGKVIGHYRDNAIGKPTLVFCPSVKNSQETAQKFRDSGFNFESIDGTMTDNQLDTILTALEEKKIDGVTSCEIATYGLDIRSISNIIMLRKTMSRALFFQMLGRGTRPEIGKMLTVFDHVGNFRELATGEAGPDDPVEKCFDVEWNFDGQEKNKKSKGEVVASLKLCPDCGLYNASSATICRHCGEAKEQKKIRYEEIDGRLIEVKGPIKFFDREASERRQIQEKVDGLIARLKIEMTDHGLAELLKQAEERGWNAMKIYWELSAGMMAVNVPLLHAICRIREYKRGWIWMQTNTIEKRLGR